VAPRRQRLTLPRSARGTRSRYNRKSRNSSFAGVLKRANQRANERVWQRQGKTSVKATLAEDGHYHPDVLALPTRVLRIALGLALLPFCSITTVTLFQRVTDADFSAQVWRSDAFVYFAIGLVINAGWFFTKLLQDFFLYLYVLGHELTHAIFVILCFGRVSGFSVTLDGGHIITNKSNILIALSPYFVPFWSVITLIVMSPLGYFNVLPHYEPILFCVLGATWSFHMLWTIWIIPRDQPDLQENGTFFSLALIYLVNVILLSALICLGSRQLSWQDFFYNWINNGTELARHAMQGAASLFRFLGL